VIIDALSAKAANKSGGVINGALAARGFGRIPASGWIGGERG
jgi:hypothetical protein